MWYNRSDMDLVSPLDYFSNCTVGISHWYNICLKVEKMMLKGKNKALVGEGVVQIFWRKKHCLFFNIMSSSKGGYNPNIL